MDWDKFQEWKHRITERFLFRSSNSDGITRQQPLDDNKKTYSKTSVDTESKSNLISDEPDRSRLINWSGTPFFLDEDGWYRVKRCYRELSTGAPSGEVGFILESFKTSLIIGGICGATIGVKPIYNDFKTRFNEYQFEGKSKFARRLVDYTLAACVRNGMQMAWRASLLTTLFTASSTTLAVYHNDIRFTDLMIALGLTGGLYGFNLGPKGMFARATLGAIFGIPLAATCKIFFWFSGYTYAELSNSARDYFDVPSVKKMKKIQRAEQIWRNESIQWIDNYKDYIYHQRRVDRAENQGIIDDSFENIKPLHGKNPDFPQKL